MRSLFVFIVFLLPLALSSQSLSKQVDQFDLIQTFNSNQDYQDWVYTTSNIIRHDLTISNRVIIEQVMADEDFFGKNLNGKVEFLNLAAKHYFDHEGTPSTKKKAFVYWNQIIQIDTSLLTSANLEKKDIPVYSSSIKGTPLEEAMKMVRHEYWQKGEKNSRLFQHCNVYEQYYTNGLNYSHNLHLNFIEYFIEKKNVEKALYVYNKIKTQVDLYYQNRLDYLGIVIEKQPKEKYARLKEYLKGMRATESMRTKLESKYFNSANDVVIVRDSLKKTKILNSSSLDIENKDQINRAIELYSKAIRQNPDFVEAQYNLGLVYAAMDNPKAILHLKEALKYESSFRTLYSLGLMEMRLGNYNDAYFLIKEASFFMNDNESRKGDLYNNLAVSGAGIKDKSVSDPPIFYIEEAIKYNENNPFYYVTRAEIYKKRGKLDLFERDIRKARRELKEIEPEDYSQWIKAFSVNSRVEVEKIINYLDKKINEYEKTFSN